MAQRTFFLSPETGSASGGVAVLHDAVRCLRSAGADAAILTPNTTRAYAGHGPEVPIFADPNLWRVVFRHWPKSAPQKLRARLGYLREQLRPGPNPKVDLRPDDIIVIPDFWILDGMTSYPAQPKVVFSQNSFRYFEGVAKARAAGFDPIGAMELHVASAKVCRHAFEILGADPIVDVPAAPSMELFPYRTEKSQRIVYMPRKRPQDAALIDAALRRRGNLQGFDLRAIDGVPLDQVAELVGDSLIFLSLLKEESLGFPAVEAMATGALVVGFTGLGAEEFFDETTGVPVSDGDVAGIVYAVERLVDQYRSEPARLDKMRKDASELVHGRYSGAAFESALLDAWSSTFPQAFSG